MESRTSHSGVTFRRPFQLAGMDGLPNRLALRNKRVGVRNRALLGLWLNITASHVSSEDGHLRVSRKLSGDIALISPEDVCRVAIFSTLTISCWVALASRSRSGLLQHKPERAHEKQLSPYSHLSG